jgi:phage baseplate assembly protein W
LLTVGGASLSVDNFTTKTTQRLLRRLLTNPGEYIWQPGYGAGLGRFLGQPINVQALTAVVRSQIFLEAAVNQTPAPVITLTAQKGGTVLCHILYTDAESGKPVPLQFSITA